MEKTIEVTQSTTFQERYWRLSRMRKGVAFLMNHWPDLSEASLRVELVSKGFASVEDVESMQSEVRGFRNCHLERARQSPAQRAAERARTLEKAALLKNHLSQHKR